MKTLAYTIPIWLYLTQLLFGVDSISTALNIILAIVGIVLACVSTLYAIFFARFTTFREIMESRMEDIKWLQHHRDECEPNSIRWIHFNTSITEYMNIMSEYRHYLNALSNSDLHKFTHSLIRKLIPETAIVQDRINNLLRNESPLP